MTKLSNASNQPESQTDFNLTGNLNDSTVVQTKPVKAAVKAIEPKLAKESKKLVDRILWTPVEKLAYLRFGKCQELQDKILQTIYGDLDEKDITVFDPITIKVYRGGNPKYGRCCTKFNFAGHTFYVCEHDLVKEKDLPKDTGDTAVYTRTLFLFEEENVLKAYNPILK